MVAPLKISLSESEKIMLEDLRVAASVVQRTRDRAHMLLLSHRGWRVSQIAEVFESHESTVRSTLRRWQERGLFGLRDAPGRGVKPRCQEEDWQFLEGLLDEGERTYTSAQLAQQLQDSRQVTLSRDRIRRGLKKRGSHGSGRGTPTATNKTRNSSSVSRLT
jgi:transposase